MFYDTVFSSNKTKHCCKHLLTHSIALKHTSNGSAFAAPPQLLAIINLFAIPIIFIDTTIHPCQAQSSKHNKHVCTQRQTITPAHRVKKHTIDIDGTEARLQSDASRRRYATLHLHMYANMLYCCCKCMDLYAYVQDITQ